jgi:hypothetical protein
MYRRRRFRHTFGGSAPRASKPAISQKQVMPKKRRKCKACLGWINPGETAVKLRLASRYRHVACTTCHQKPAGTKIFHQGCVPTDVNAAMGFDPALHAVRPAAHAVAPPSKPPDPHEAALAALAALQHALVLRAARKGDAFVKQIEGQFKTVLNLQARAVRPGTPAEGETATSVALQRIVKLVFD